MNKFLVVGSFFKNKKNAETHAKKKEKIYKLRFELMKLGNGWLVVSRRQIKDFNIL